MGSFLLGLSRIGKGNNLFVKGQLPTQAGPVSPNETKLDKQHLTCGPILVEACPF